MSFGKKILDYKEDILNDLSNLIAISSVSAEGDKKPQQALEYMLNRAEQMGLSTKNIDNLAGHIEYGNGERLCGVLTHLDVVPAGEGWSVPAFELTRRDGRLYGRGVADDKGAAVVAMYCLKALKDSNAAADSKIRLILGTNEETGMSDVEHYFSKEQLPDISFTPDSDYGICSCEKGILQFTLTGKNNSSVLCIAKGGSVVNAVPDSAVFTLSEAVDISKNAEGNFCINCENGKTVLTSKGTAAHAMEAYKGFNSVTHAVKAICRFFGEEKSGSLLAFINNYIGLETDGTLLGIKQSDEQSGELTLNVGVIDISDKSASVKIDIRYPVSADYDKIVSTISDLACAYNLKMHIDSHLAPLNVPKDSEIICTLQEAYREITGETPNIYSTGGGTYARSLGGRGVAFGPVFPDDYSNMHKADESLNEEKFFLHAQICLEAMYRMFTK